MHRHAKKPRLKAALALVLLAGCADDAASTLLAAEPLRAESPADPDQGPLDLAGLREGNTAFAFDLYRQLAATSAGANLGFSPYSISSALALTYAVPTGTRYLIDAFDDQDHDPVTDHGFMVNLMPEAQMVRVVNCLNKGQTCDDTATRRTAP